MAIQPASIKRLRNLTLTSRFLAEVYAGDAAFDLSSLIREVKIDLVQAQVHLHIADDETGVAARQVRRLLGQRKLTVVVETKARGGATTYVQMFQGARIIAHELRLFYDATEVACHRLTLSFRSHQVI